MTKDELEQPTSTATSAEVEAMYSKSLMCISEATAHYMMSCHLNVALPDDIRKQVDDALAMMQVSCQAQIGFD